MANETLLIVFAKNFIAGKVKTRLAASIGPERAMSVYKVLFQKTVSVAKNLPCDTSICFSECIPDDTSAFRGISVAAQEGIDLGDRMANAFNTAFAAGYKQVVIIGSDCYDLTSAIVMDAFQTLSSCDVVIGPARDGGYYLLGMNRLYASLFQHISWSTSAVYQQTISAIERLNLRWSALPILSDIDTVEDLMDSRLLTDAPHAVNSDSDIQ